ncbi:hypothetical protein [Helicobacter pylori]|uniref:hypothetical protein n=1 Tax=Helicobacter pylori TaxID=210 RepID=UPI000EB459AF|nr:hypothetical protein [Helicobacter pylori]RKV02579.1 hypothetical protein DDP44_08215 [Helicobacter pylori]WQX57632.1 hypothetical protein KVL95_06755 [Helicobacter pylori]
MWHEKFLKVIPALVFLLCILEIFELFLIIEDMSKTEKLEKDLKSNLQMVERIIDLLNNHLEGMDLEHFHDKKYRVK